MGSEPVLELDEVTVRYPAADRPAVDRLSLRIRPGERVALVGPSGAGKSTIISLANGLVHPTTGRVTVLGVDSRELAHGRHRATRRRIGTVHQAFALIGPLRVAHNVAAGRLGHWSAARALRSLHRPRDVATIADHLDQLGIADKLWERADQLSGGQQQRVAVARVLYQQPDLVLADEPVSNLDPARSKATLDLLVETVEAGPGRALVASLHDAPLALSHAGRIVGLRDGRVAFDAPSAEVGQEMLDELYALELLDGEA